MAAPRNGPAIAANPKAADITPRYAARWASGIIFVVIKTLPEKTPEAPRPATARPMISATEVGAVVQTRDPISKMTMATR